MTSTSQYGGAKDFELLDRPKGLPLMPCLRVTMIAMRALSDREWDSVGDYCIGSRKRGQGRELEGWEPP